MTRTTDDPAEKRSVSFPSSLLRAATLRWKAMGYRTLSAYLQHLMRRDVSDRGEHIIAEEPPAYPPKADPLRKAGQQMAKIARAKKRAAKHQKKSAA